MTAGLLSGICSHRYVKPQGKWWCGGGVMSEGKMTGPPEVKTWCFPPRTNFPASHQFLCAWCAFLSPHSVTADFNFFGFRGTWFMLLWSSLFVLFRNWLKPHNTAFFESKIKNDVVTHWTQTLVTKNMQQTQLICVMCVMFSLVLVVCEQHYSKMYQWRLMTFSE